MIGGIVLVHLAVFAAMLDSGLHGRPARWSPSPVPSGRWFTLVCGGLGIAAGLATIAWSLHAKATCDIGSCGYVRPAYVVLPIAGDTLLALAAILWPRVLSAARRARGTAPARRRSRPGGP